MQVKEISSYFNPFSDKHLDKWSSFEHELSFGEQLITIALAALATLVSLPILGLGGVAVFRALVEYYDPTDLPDTLVGDTANKTHSVASRSINPLSKDEFIKQALTFFPDSGGNPIDLREILRDLFDKYGNGRLLLSALKVGKENSRADILEQAIKLHADFDSPVEFSKLMRLVNAFKENRMEKVDRLARFCKGFTTTKEIKSIYRSLKSIPQAEESELMRAFQVIGVNFPSALERVQSLKAIQINVESGKRVDMLTNFSELLLTVKSIFILPKVLSNIQKITEDDHEAVKRLVFRLKTDKDDGTTLESILDCIVDIPEELRKQLLNCIQQCFVGIEGEDLFSILQILKQIASLKKSERVDVVAVAIAHIRSTMQPIERRLILSALLDIDSNRSEIDDEQLQKMIKVKKQLIQFFGKIPDSVDKREMMDEINKIPEIQREKLFSTIAPLLPQIQNGAQFKELIGGIKMIAPEYRDLVVSEFENGLPEDFNWTSIVQYAFERNPHREAILRKSKEYLRFLLENETNEEIARDIAQKIWDNRQTFDIIVNRPDPLLDVLLAIVPMAEGHDKSSYSVYRRLLQMDAKNETPEIEIPVSTVCEKRVRMNQSHFETMARDRQKVTFKDLNPPINMDTLRRLFDSFDTRLSTLSATASDNIFSKGVSGCLITIGVAERQTPRPEHVRYSYQILRDTFLGSAYVRDTLNQERKNDQIVPTGYLHMYAAFKLIMNSSTAIDPHTGLTAREEMLIRMISSIQNCGTGKSEGFAEFYSHLPVKAKFIGGTAESSKKEQAKVYLTGVVQSVLGTYLSEFGPMAKKLVGSRYDPQFVHTRKYLKNLIAKRVGLQWDISFDSYPACIHDTLYQKSLEDVLTIFYRYFTPATFLQNMYKHIISDLIPNLDEIKEVDSRLIQAQEMLDAELNKGSLLELQKELSKERAKMQQQISVQLAARKINEGEDGYAEAQEKLKNAKAAYNSSKESLSQITARLEDEKKKLGVDELETRLKEIEEELEVAQQDVNQELFDQLNALVEGSGNRSELFAPIDSTLTKYTIQPKGVVEALIKARYFAVV